MSFFPRFHSIRLVLACTGLLFFSAPTGYAASPSGDNSAVLQQIANNTSSTNATYLSQVQNVANQILTQVTAILQQMLAWDKPDQKDTVSPAQQQNFASYSSAYLSLLNSQNSDTNNQQLLDVIFNTTPATPAITNAYTTENDVSYFILQNSVYIPPSNRTSKETAEKYKNALNINTKALNYILNASAARTPHQTQLGDWTGTADNKLRFTNMRATLLAVQSHGAYVLSQLLLDQENNSMVKKLQFQLLAQATDSTNWFTKILNERISTVIRQILMYESQNYVLLSQLLDVQKQQLTTQVMTNSLLILNNQSNEDALIRKAKNKNAS